MSNIRLNDQYITNHISSNVGTVCGPNQHNLVNILKGGKKHKMKGGSRAYSLFNHVKTPSYGYSNANAAANNNHILVGSRPLYSENTPMGSKCAMLGGKRKRKRKPKSKKHKSKRYKSKRYKSKRHKSKRHKSKRHKSKKHKSKRHKSKKHKSKRHKSKKHKSRKKIQKGGNIPMGIIGGVGGLGLGYLLYKKLFKSNDNNENEKFYDAELDTASSRNAQYQDAGLINPLRFRESKIDSDRQVV